MESAAFNHMNNLPEGLPRKVMVKFPGSSKNPIQLLVPPGATASELLQHLGLKPGDFIVSKGSADTVFGKDEPLHPALSDGDCLYVTSAVDAGL